MQTCCNGVTLPWQSSEHQPVTLSVFVWYLGPYRGYIKQAMNSSYLPLAGRNVSVGIVHTALKVYPIFSRLQASYGGSSANSLTPLLCPHNAECHPLRAVYPFLHPLIVFSTILVGGSIIAFALIFSYILLIFTWVACSYCVHLIQPYPCPRHCSPVHYWISTVTTKAAGLYNLFYV